MSLPLLDLEQKVIDALKRCFDPEIPVDIYELGLIYEINIDEESNVNIKMTLTSPMCPSAQSMPEDVQNKVSLVPGVKSVKVDVVWNPPWNQDMMSDVAKLELGFL